MKTFILPEMMIHIPLCTHKDPKNLLIASNTPDPLKQELARYRNMDAVVIGASSLLDDLRGQADNSMDVVILDAQSSDAAVAAHLNRIIKEDGLAVMRHPSLDDTDANKQLLQILGNYFKIIMPYRLEDGTTLLLCSKGYHPTADLILQRSDLLEGHQYYNCDVHIAAFAMPQYVRKNYLGLLRN